MNSKTRKLRPSPVRRHRRKIQQRSIMMIREGLQMEMQMEDIRQNQQREREWREPPRYPTPTGAAGNDLPGWMQQVVQKLNRIESIQTLVCSEGTIQSISRREETESQGLQWDPEICQANIQGLQWDPEIC